ncbi:hypothetical protein QR680_004835 [Steinernema hermaphroditum]|uniref:Eukaryotic translation initiation factor 3 subunit 10 n=1 Tax=Steinernema hermaphroditum TaxID=289476 RepID=A0AA39HR28_9BILA|nr:hypothetical protein QR680_004835 [Steinernema hermaphroditum]
MAEEEDNARFKYLVRGPGKRQIKPNVNFLESDLPDFDDEDEDEFDGNAADVGEEDDEEGSDASVVGGEDDSGSGSGSGGSEDDDSDSDDEAEDDDEAEHEQTESLQENGMPTLHAFNTAASSPAGHSNSAPVLSREQSVQGLTRKPPERNTTCTLCLNLKFSKKKEEVIQCDKCGIAVHESCYGPMDFHDDSASQGSSSSTEPWFCEPCLYGLLEPPYCALCPNRFGAFKRAEGGDWVHLNCALWIAGVTFLDDHHMTAVSWRAVDSKEFGKKACNICEEKIESRTGITTQCDAALCKTFFHISCAQKHGLLFDHSDTAGEASSSHTLDPRIVACKKHSSTEEVKAQRRAYLRMQAEEERRMVNYRRKILTPRELRKKEHQKRLHMKLWNSLNITYNHDVPGPRLLHQHPEFVMEMLEKLDGPDGGAEEFKKSFNKVHRVDKLNCLPPGFSTEFVKYFDYRQEKLIPRLMADLANSERKKEELKAKQILIHERIEKIQEESNETREKLENADSKMKSFGSRRLLCTSLHDMIKDRRHKVWTVTHEEIMMKHLELCVNLRNSAFAKDALFQYKSLTQQGAVESLQTVLTHFLDLAEKKIEDAQQASIEKVEEIDDLDQADAPENLLLSVVSGATTQDRMDRAVLSPWLRFLWDSYRNCLNLLRNNAMVECLYHSIVRQSFKFCIRYKRRAEFRKLCDILRLHLNQIQKSQHLGHVVKLTSTESLSLMQETRLFQLDTAVQMQVWQEAYRSAEDLHGMMQLSKEIDKRMVKPTSYANYYDKLALIFSKGGNSLFHAAALLQKFIIYKDMKKSFGGDEAEAQATRVLLAALSIPEGSDAPSDLANQLDMEEQHIANVRVLSNLLHLPVAPTRATILKEVVRLGIPDIASAPARMLHGYFEREFAPLRMAKVVGDQLEKLTEAECAEHAQYLEALRHVIATKILKQLSSVYDSVSIERVQKIIPFFTPLELERFLVDVAKHHFVKVHIDHRDSCVRFSSPQSTYCGIGAINSIIDGAQAIEPIRCHLESLFVLLRDTANILDKENLLHEAEEKLKRHANVYVMHKDKDYERILSRRRKIETYKETTEAQRTEKALKLQQEAAQREERRRKEELQRLEAEAIATEKQRRLAEQRELEEKIRQEKIKKMQQNPMYQAIVKAKGEDLLKDMDPEAVLHEQRRRLEFEREELQAKLCQQEKKFDHQIRAYHLEEMKIRKAMSEETAEKLPVIFEAYEERRVKGEIDHYHDQVKNYEILQLARKDIVTFVENMKQQQADAFAEKMQKWREYVDDKRREILVKRHEERKKKRREEWEKETLLQQQKLQEEQNRARREQMHGRSDRPREPDQETKADQDGDWRSTMSARPAEPRRPAAHATSAVPDRIREPIQETKADQDGDWRRAMAPRPVAHATAAVPDRIREPETKADQDGDWRRVIAPRSSQPRRPAAHVTSTVSDRAREADQETKADQDGDWRRVIAPRPAARVTSAVPDRIREPDQETKADQDGDWRRVIAPRSSQPRRPAAHVTSTVSDRAREADQETKADQDGDWRRVSAPRSSQPRRPAARVTSAVSDRAREPDQKTKADQDGDWRSAPAAQPRRPAARVTSAVSDRAREPDQKTKADQDSDWRVVSRS